MAAEKVEAESTRASSVSLANARVTRPGKGLSGAWRIISISFDQFDPYFLRWNRENEHALFRLVILTHAQQLIEEALVEGVVVRDREGVPSGIGLNASTPISYRLSVNRFHRPRSPWFMVKMFDDSQKIRRPEAISRNDTAKRLSGVTFREQVVSVALEIFAVQLAP
jgi:hypothetical protein